MEKLRIALMNLEPEGKNIALEKIRMYHQQRDDVVIDVTPFEAKNYDKIYVSSVLSYTSKSYVPKDAICGGSGFDLKTTLPPEIEEMKPKINIGFTSRGCIRNCDFCVVPKKEGPFKITGDIYDFWDRKSKLLRIYDNNILINKDHFFKIADQIIKENLRIDFNQGFDIRLIDLDIAKKLKKIFHIYHIKFAMDNAGMEDIFKKKFEILKKAGIPPFMTMVYILIGFNTTLEDDLKRIKFIHESDSSPFVMVWNAKASDAHIRVRRWCNRFLYISPAFQKYVKARRRRIKKPRPIEDSMGSLENFNKTYISAHHRKKPI